MKLSPPPLWLTALALVIIEFLKRVSIFGIPRKIPPLVPGVFILLFRRLIAVSGLLLLLSISTLLLLHPPPLPLKSLVPSLILTMKSSFPSFFPPFSFSRSCPSSYNVTLGFGLKFLFSCAFMRASPVGVKQAANRQSGGPQKASTTGETFQQYFWIGRDGVKPRTRRADLQG